MIPAIGSLLKQGCREIDTLEGLRARFDFSRGLPYGWILLRGKRAQRYIRDSIKAELRWQRREAMKATAGGKN